MYRRLAVTIIADLNVVVAEITVMSSASHPSLSPHRVSQNIYGVKTYYIDKCRVQRRIFRRRRGALTSNILLKYIIILFIIIIIIILLLLLLLFRAI